MKEKEKRRIEKEIKKAQKKGIYNPKLKLGIVALILVIGTVIGISYAYYTGTSTNTLTIKGTVSKKIMVRVEAGEHGKVNELDLATAQTDYGIQARFIVTPETNYEYKGVSCKETYNSSTDVTSKVNPSYSSGTLTIMPKTSKDVTCTVEFAEKKINVKVSSSGHGNITPSSQEVVYNSAARFTVTPDTNYEYKGVSCTPTATTNYSGTILTITPQTRQDVTCTVTFEENFAGKIIAKAKSNSTYKETIPAFSNGCPTSNSDTSCSGIYKWTEGDGSGNNTVYYFRGKVDNNYVKFGRGITSDNSSQHDLIWRIVRINGDGSIRLILDSDIGTSAFAYYEFSNYVSAKKYVGYTYDNDSSCTNANPCKSEYNNGLFTNSNGGTDSKIKTYLEDWYKNNLASYDKYIEYGIYCNDTSYGHGDDNDNSTSTLYYGSFERNYSINSIPSLKCSDPKKQNGQESRKYGGVYKLKIGLLSADELRMGGYAAYDASNSESATSLNYLKKSYRYWLFSPDIGNNAPVNMYSSYDGRISSATSSDHYNVLPVINLKADTIITKEGTGTSTNPYVIK